MWAMRPRRVALGLGPPGALLPGAGAGPDAWHAPVPLLGDRDVRLHPVGSMVGKHLEWAVVDRAEVGRDDLPAGFADLQAEVEVVAVEAGSRSSSKRMLRTVQGDSTSRKPSSVSTSPTCAYGGASSRSHEKAGQVAAAVLLVAVTNDARVTEPSHQAMLRTPIAPTQPTRRRPDR